MLKRRIAIPCTRYRQVNVMPKLPLPKKIAKFCFLVIFCQFGSSLQHTKNRTKLEYGKVPKLGQSSRSKLTILVNLRKASKYVVWGIKMMHWTYTNHFCNNLFDFIK